MPSVSYALEAGSEIEMLTTDDNLGTGAINLTGNELSPTPSTAMPAPTCSTAAAAATS